MPVGTIQGAALWDAVLAQLATEIDAGRDPEWVDESVTAETFDAQAYLDRFAGRLESPAQRRALTKRDPILFGLCYTPHLLRDHDGVLSVAENHLAFARWALRLPERPGPRESRTAFVGPRESGKSTWLFKVIPLFAAAHGHIRFIAAFASSATQSETHLAGFKRELDTNDLLRGDFPALCQPARRPSGASVADSQAMVHTASGFSFAARGIDGEVLGLVDPRNRRPELILLDDIEPDESSYSAYQMGKRRTTLIDTVLPMNERAHVALAGTVTMPGSLVHQLVRAANGEEPERWIVEENFTALYFPPIIARDDGSERSIWPAKWPMPFLESIRHTRSFAKNFANDPMGADGGYWTMEDFRYDPDAVTTGELLSIDPATTTRTTSDPTGVAILGQQPAPRGGTGRVVVEDAYEVRLVGAALRDHVLGVLARRPNIRAVLVESNQGGEHWRSVLHDLPVRLYLVHQTAAKESRAADLLDRYQRGRVVHRRRLVRLEEQMVAFPRAAHDDMIDAVGAGVERLLVPAGRGRSSTIHPT